jgi:poly(3-hydroxybutyrate) depolymerase
MIPKMLPTAKGTCPTLKSGNMQSIMLNGKSMSWSMSVGTKASSPTGPIVIYWHGTGTNAQESATAMGNGITDIVNLGGLVAAADSTSSTGTNTGDGVWYTGDVDYADFIIACAIQQLNIDTSHLHVAGYSAGALQTGYMWYARSGYVASAIFYSGGGFGSTLQDPSNAPPMIGAHGAAGGSSCTITSTNCDFLAGSTTMFESTAKAAGSPMVIDCDDGSSHVDITRLSKLSPVAWQFFKDHPFKAGKPDAYAKGLPSGFPSYCKIQ